MSEINDAATPEATRCSVCSEVISGAPLAEFAIEWRGTPGAETQTLCDNPDCWDSLRDQWTEFMDDNRRERP